jgi:acetoin utilization protein AcuB
MNPDIPTVDEYMTPGAHVVAPHEKVARAKTLMRDHSIRHLAVMEDGKLVGVVSDRDLAGAQTGKSKGGPYVDEAMSSKPYTVASGTLLNAVVRTMAKRKFGSAVVTDHGAIVGVFTTTDALEALCDVLEGTVSRRTTESVGVRPPSRGRRTKLTARELKGRPSSRAW